MAEVDRYQAAFSQGKIEDSRWMAQFASICLEGNALRWHTTLDNETKNDWALFESALLKQYPEEPRYERSRLVKISSASGN